MSAPESHRKLAAIFCSDVVGFSRLMGEDDQATVEAIVSIRELMSTQIVKCFGRIVDCPGDALLAEFPSAVEALRSAMSIQQEIADRNASVPSSQQMTLRIGLNLGDVIERDAALYGEGVNVAARLQSLGRPGGVCISGSVFDQVDGRLPFRHTFAGEQVVKNIARPVRVYHVDMDALPTVPVRGVGRSNLTPSHSPLIGRAADEAALIRDLQVHRLVTIVGAGGIGKTLLARSAAAQWVGTRLHGVWWVDLATVSDALGIVPAVAMAAGLSIGDGEPVAMLVRALVNRDLLLVFDNCEHLVGDVARIAEACLDGSPGVRILATSQEPLRISGERRYRLDPLAVPPADATLTAARDFGAFVLFETRAAAADRAFVVDERSVTTVIDVCRQLDGIALAIEMAAARLPALGLDGLRSLLSSRLQMLRSSTRAAPSRQQTLRATLDWSYALLTTSEQSVLRKLATFAGTFRMDTAQRVTATADLDEWAALELVASLVEKSFIHIAQPEPLRYRLLETVRIYAAEKLRANGEAECAAARHRMAMAALAEEMGESCLSMADEAFLSRYAPDDGDLRLAFDRACDAKDLETLAAGALALSQLNYENSPRSVEQGRQSKAYDLLSSGSPLARARLWLWLSSFLSPSIPAVTRQTAAREAVDAAREVGDPQLLNPALWRLAVEFARVGDFGMADQCAAEAREVDSAGWSLHRRRYLAEYDGTISMYRGDVEGYVRLYRQALAWAEEGGAKRAAAWHRHCIADAELMRGNWQEAIVLEKAAIAELQSLDQPRRACSAMGNLCSAFLFCDDLASARSVAVEAWQYLSWYEVEGDLLDHVALLATREGMHADATRLLGSSDAWYSRSQNTRQPNEARLVKLTIESIGTTLPAGDLERLRAEGATLTSSDANAIVRRILRINVPPNKSQTSR